MSLPFQQIPVSACKRNDRDDIMDRVKELSASYGPNAPVIPPSPAAAPIPSPPSSSSLPLEHGQCKPNDIQCILQRYLLSAFPNLTPSDVMNLAEQFNLSRQPHITRDQIASLINHIRATRHDMLPSIPVPLSIVGSQTAVTPESNTPAAAASPTPTQEQQTQLPPADPFTITTQITLPPPSSSSSSSQHPPPASSFDSQIELPAMPAMPSMPAMPAMPVYTQEHEGKKALGARHTPSKQIRLTIPLSDAHTKVECGAITAALSPKYTHVRISVPGVYIENFEWCSYYLFVKVNDFYTIYKATQDGSMIGGLCEFYISHTTTDHVISQTGLTTAVPLSLFKDQALDISVYDYHGNLLNPQGACEVALLIDLVFEELALVDVV
jgi:hypothetical protein